MPDQTDQCQQQSTRFGLRLLVPGLTFAGMLAYCHGGWQGNHCLIDVLYLVQQRVQAGLCGCVPTILPTQVCYQVWQLVPKQVIRIAVQPVPRTRLSQ